MSTIDAAEVVDARAGELEVLAAGFAAMLGDGDGGAAGEVFAGDGVGIGGDFGDGAGGEELAAEFACAGAEVEQVVGGADDVGVVLDDEDGVAEVAQVLHDADELARCRGCAGRWRARRGRRARRRDASRAMWRAGCAAIRRRRAWSRGGRG